MKNKEKRWFEILKPLKEFAAWDYVTALRGPDVNSYMSEKVKLVFSLPLRGTNGGKPSYEDTTDFTREVDIELVLEVFEYLRKGGKRYYRHYLEHIRRIWETLYFDVAIIIVEAINKKRPNLPKLATKYLELVHEWLESEDITLQKEIKDV